MNTTTYVKTIRPASSIVHRADGFLIECDMPGVPREGVSLTLEKNLLTISGRRVAANCGAIVHRETQPCDYRRQFVLEAPLDLTRIDARHEAGVLRIFLPKTEAPKPRHIAVG